MLLNKKNQQLEFSEKVMKRVQEHKPVSDEMKRMFKNETKASLNERFKKAKANLS